MALRFIGRREKDRHEARSPLAHSASICTEKGVAEQNAIRLIVLGLISSVKLEVAESRNLGKALERMEALRVARLEIDWSRRRRIAECE